MADVSYPKHVFAEALAIIKSLSTSNPQTVMREGRVCYQSHHRSAELYPDFCEQHRVITTVCISKNYCALTYYKEN